MPLSTWLPCLGAGRQVVLLGPSAPSTHSRWRHRTRLWLRKPPVAGHGQTQAESWEEDPPWCLQVEGLVMSWSNQIRARTAQPIKPRRTLMF